MRKFVFYLVPFLGSVSFADEESGFVPTAAMDQATIVATEILAVVINLVLACILCTLVIMSYRMVKRSLDRV